MLDAVDDSRAELVTFLAELVRMPSVGGTDAENEAQQHLAGAFDRVGLEVDHWRLPLPELLAEPDFPASRSTATRRGDWSGGCRETAAVAP